MSFLFGPASSFWPELIQRSSGPLHFRFVLQPLMAAALAVRDGIKDARRERVPYLWTIWRDPTRRVPRLREGIRAVGRVLVLAIVLDVVYQLIVFHGLRPLQTVVIAIVLAFIPYLILRGPATRIARRVLHRRESNNQARHLHG